MTRWLAWSVFAACSGAVHAADLRAGADRAAVETTVSAAASPPALALVVRDRIALRGAPRESAPLHATLWQGDGLEVRGRYLDYLQVYDHHRERTGYVRASDLRVLRLEAGESASLLAVVQFLRDEPGAETLGIAYSAAYLKAAPAQAIGADLFDALGTFAERLARRASVVREAGEAEVVAAHLDVAQRYGVVLRSFASGGRTQLCYDGEAFRRVLALPASDEQKARAALALTRPDCIDPEITPRARHDLDEWRADVLDRVPGDALPEYLTQRLRVRRAAVWAGLAYQRARDTAHAHATAHIDIATAAGTGADAGTDTLLQDPAVRDAGQRALDALAGVDRKQLAESDADAYTDAAIRVGASRWAAEPVVVGGTSLGIALSPGEPGQTCIDLVDRGNAKRVATAPSLLRKCTYATVWPASARANAAGTALVVAVQPIDAWRELWVFRRDGQAWTVTALPPGTDAPELGYVEFAGWVSGEPQLLVARETRVGKTFERHFELRDLATLAVLRQADEPGHLTAFYRWQDPAWKQLTVSLRQ